MIKSNEIILEENQATAGPEEVFQIQKSQLEQLYEKGTLQESEYLALAKEFRDSNRIREERNILEECVQIYANEDAKELLKNLVVNIAEETPILQKEFGVLFTNLTLNEREAIATISSKDFQKEIASRASEGIRQYYYEDVSSNIAYFIQVNRAFSSTSFQIWCKKEDDTLSYYEADAESVKKWEVPTKDGKFEGELHSLYCNRKTGDVYQETMQFSKGVLTGSYEINVHTGTEETDLLAMWEHQDGLEMKKYVGTFDEAGMPLVEQIEKETKAEKVVFAYDSEHKNYLTCDSSLVANGFQANVIGFVETPYYTTYEPYISEDHMKQTVNLEEIQVRVYNGVVQWFDGTRWNDVQNVEAMCLTDPLQEYRIAEENTSEDTDPSRVQSLLASVSTNSLQMLECVKQSGQVKEEPAKKQVVASKETSKTGKTETKPSKTQATQQSAAKPNSEASSGNKASTGSSATTNTQQQQEPTSQPSAPPQPEPAPQPQPQPEPTPQPTPPPQPEPAPAENVDTEVDAGGFSDFFVP